MSGASWSSRDIAGAAAARLAEPVWGPRALMRDLELRLALAPSPAPSSVRVPRWEARIKSLAAEDAFYWASYKVDPVGTAETLLVWRDALVDAGWDGQAIAGGGARLDALSAIAHHTIEPLPPGEADRLASIERALASNESAIYEEMTLVEDRALWSRRWQRIFDRLQSSGTVFRGVNTEFGHLASNPLSAVSPLPPSSPSGADGVRTDLALLQRLLVRNTTVKKGDVRDRIRGDGSLLVFRGETPTEVGELVASFTAKSPTSEFLFVRSLDASPLDAAFARRGIATQGHDGESSWRPAMQILPLSIELAFEPRDPYRVLELLTLPVGPFRGQLGTKLAKAVARQPGIGGQEWERRKTDASKSLHESRVRIHVADGKSNVEAASLADDYVAVRLQRVVDWFESPGAPAEGISRSKLLEITARVRAWLQPQVAPDNPNAIMYHAAFAQAKGFTEALTNSATEVFTREETRQLFDSVARSAESQTIFVEEAGRHAHVSHPSAIVAPASTVIFWNFVAGTERRAKTVPWNVSERAALRDAGLSFSEPSQLLGAELTSWRRAILAARERVVLVIPRSSSGTRTADHPLWDEIIARLGIDEDAAAVAAITRDVSAVLQSNGSDVATTQTLTPLPLPDARGVWSIAPEALAGSPEKGASATAIQCLVSCPMSWVLEHRAGLRFGAVAKVADGPRLNGNLGHRLVEELFLSGTFELDEATFLQRVSDTLDRLIRTEGATLLLEGATFERVQLIEQIRRAMRELQRYLRKSRFRIAAVEEPIALGTAEGSPHGRLDVRLVDEKGKDAVLDLKWGASSYRKLLETGRAIQLAVYAIALRAQKGRASMPPVAYYAMSAAKVLTADDRMLAPTKIDGISLDETWSRVERTQLAVRASLARGQIPVANTRRSLPLLEQLGVPESKRDEHFSSEVDTPCEYCSFSSLCGRAWEEFQ